MLRALFPPLCLRLHPARPALFEPAGVGATTAGEGGEQWGRDSQQAQARGRSVLGVHASRSRPSSSLSPCSWPPIAMRSCKRWVAARVCQPRPQRQQRGAARVRLLPPLATSAPSDQAGGAARHRTAPLSRSLARCRALLAASAAPLSFLLSHHGRRTTIPFPEVSREAQHSAAQRAATASEMRRDARPDQRRRVDDPPCARSARLHMRARGRD